MNYIKNSKLIKKIDLFINRIFGHDIDYKKYWYNRYAKGDTSGAGSYGLLADFKAEVINNFIVNNNIDSVIDFGCGDGNQLIIANYKKYMGLDVAESSIAICIARFQNDKTKSFTKYDPLSFLNNGYFSADLVLSLDVLYHIIPENEFIKSLEDIFSCSGKYVILYTSINAYEREVYKKGVHVRHRDVISYLTKFKDFEVIDIVPQKYPQLSSASFIILKRKFYE